MTRVSGWSRLAIAVLVGGVLVAAQGPVTGNTKPTTVRVALARSLPSMKGESLKVTVAEITYAPGAASAPHSHPCPVAGYVVAGAVRMQVKGEAEAVYRAGDSFWESANGVHQISANASSTEPAKFVVYFLCDHETQLSVPPADGTK